MRQNEHNPRRWPASCGTLLTALAGASLFLSGCHACCDGIMGRDPCATIPPGAIPSPVGTYACQWQTAQIAKADLDKFVIHQNEWYMGGDTLGPDGKRHMTKIADRLPHVPCPVIIATSDNEELDNTRREFVVKKLADAGVDDAENRVVLAVPEAEGMYGQEAVRNGTIRQMGIGGMGMGGGMMGGGMGGGMMGGGMGGGMFGGGMGGGMFGGGGMGGGGMGFF